MMSEFAFETITAIVAVVMGVISSVSALRTRRSVQEADEEARQAERARDAAVAIGPRTRDEFLGEWGAVKLGALRRNPDLAQKVFDDIRRLRPPQAAA
jgi:hypothetical protein